MTKIKKIAIFVVILVLIFTFLYYKKILFGNNISENRVEEDILESLNNYNADINVTINSNKTQNLYEIHQEVKDDYSMQEVVSGEDIEGVRIELNQKKLKVSNTKLSLEKVYDNYTNLLNNALFLNSFVSDYKNTENNSQYSQEDGNLIFEVKLNSSQNTYIKYKKLYVDTETKKPTKLEVKDNTKKETICIVYTNIELK